MLPRADPSHNRSCTFSKRVSSLVYFVRWYPPHIVSEVVHEVHEKIFQFFLKVTALEGKTLDSDHFSRLRIEVALPYRKAGVALRELHRIAPAAYLASWLDAATVLCECRAAPLGSFVGPGLDEPGLSITWFNGRPRLCPHRLQPCPRRALLEHTLGLRSPKKTGVTASTARSRIFSLVNSKTPGSRSSRIAGFCYSTLTHGTPPGAPTQPGNSRGFS